MIRFIKRYEATQAKQHPVGMTFQWAPIVEGPHYGNNNTLFNSPADWISPNEQGGYKDEPPPADGTKVLLSDTDHLWGTGGDGAWVWKSFARGLNPIYMDKYEERSPSHPPPSENLPADESARRAMGYTLTYAGKMNLAAMAPSGELSSSGYALADPGWEYLIYVPTTSQAMETVIIDLSTASRTFQVEWCNPRTGEIRTGGTVMGGARQSFTAPFLGAAVLYLVAEKHDNREPVSNLTRY